MRQYIVKILTCLIILIYVSGLSKHLVIGTVHVIHHYFAQTLGQHFNVEHSHIKIHGHSHNSFVDFALFKEEKNQSHQGENEAPLPSHRQFNFSSHLLSCCVLPDVDIHILKIIMTTNNSCPITPYIKPPYPPPRIL